MKWFWFALLVTFSIVPIHAQELPTAKTGDHMPPDVLVWLSRFPEDTETIVVSNRVVIPNPSEIKFQPPLGFYGATSMPSTIPVVHLQEPVLEFVLKQNPSRVVFGAKNFEVVSSFGGMRCEGVVVISFPKPLGDEKKKLQTSMQSLQKELRDLQGHEVIVLPADPNRREPWEKEKPWEGNFITVFDEQTLLVATSDQYLESLLGRLDVPPDEQKLRQRYRLLAMIDPQASVWMVREVPQKNEQADRLGYERVIDAAAWMTSETDDTRLRQSPPMAYFYKPAPGKAFEDTLERVAQQRTFGKFADGAVEISHNEDLLIVKTHPKGKDLGEMSRSFFLNPFFLNPQQGIR